MTLELDSLLNHRYRIREELGHGGMGAVYRGYDENLGVEVAVKENLFASPESERQFKREAVLLASLRHPHLPRVTDHFVIEGQGQYLVMDFVAGDDANQVLTRNGGPLPEDKVVGWALEILDALKYLHSRTPPIIHRDIKPGNIKITPDGRAVLVDFGLAKFHDVSQSTTVGAKALTPGYAPPEQYGIGRTDSRTDLYSLGATLYTLLSNQMPADSLERAMGNKTLTPLRELNPAVSEIVADAIEQSLEIQPEDRFETAGDFAKALAPQGRPATALRPTAPSTVASDVPATRRITPAEVATGPKGKTTTKPRILTQSEPRPATTPTPQRGVLGPVLGVIFVLALGAGLFGLFQSGIIKLNLPGAVTASTSTGVQLNAPTETNTAPAPTTGLTQPPATLAATDAPTDIPTPAATDTPAASPTPAQTPIGGNSGQIAFVSERDGAPQIFIMGVDGTNPTRLTSLPDGACQPAWSPDGTKIAFVTPCNRKADQYARAAIYVMNADGSSIQPLITKAGGVFDPDWSAQGIAFTYLDNTTPQIWVANDNGSNARALSEPRSKDSQPSWSPGGDKLVFMNTSRAGQNTLYWMYKDGSFKGSNPDQVTRDQSATSPVWSPAGDLVAYILNQQISVVQWDQVGFGSVTLTQRGPNADPNWSPDGQWLTFESWRDAANHDIYIMTSSGGQQTRLTDDPAQDYQPAWRP